MRILEGKEEKEAQGYLRACASIAMHSNCLRSRCGSVIVKNGRIIGEGFNSPPNHERLFKCVKDTLPKDFKSDKTCCVHAEQRAIMDALKKNPANIAYSRIYFIRLDENGKQAVAGKPYCTICSKMALDAGIAEFVLLHEEGITVYNTKEYNDLSFAYRED